MKYTVVKTVTEINCGSNAIVQCNVSLCDKENIAINKARKMYGEIVNGFAECGDLVATSYDEHVDQYSVVAKVFGQQTVIVIAVNKVNESGVDDEL
jgi:hypothetical protein